MEQIRIYRVSILFIGVLVTVGLLWCILLVLALIQGGSLTLFITLIFPFTFIGYAIYLSRKRNEGKGFYWDDKGIVIDLKGNRVYWEEIEDIKYSNVRGMKSTVIYPHYTNHEKIRIRQGKSLPTPAHLIDWILIEKAKEYHKNLMKVWEEKNNTQK
ncbi:hypothetical protein E2K98_29595 [Bacillus salipaludis]|uniref:Uncharacterized protein n=1 Tax=Bacillus salipaludis TaxID=2547811 RepID=A0A4R5VI51_9BACI|nr:hypothetical protein [Bacillus salipaludis]MDQ6597874.1 hypothetical protein [Bacillus salipaludis]TDK54200.1 hypothetical protein E2K98_29595 [Bacillus salipaludis]